MCWCTLNFLWFLCFLVYTHLVTRFFFLWAAMSTQCCVYYLIRVLKDRVIQWSRNKCFLLNLILFYFWGLLNEFSSRLHVDLLGSSWEDFKDGGSHLYIEWCVFQWYGKLRVGLGNLSLMCYFLPSITLKLYCACPVRYVNAGSQVGLFLMCFKKW